MKKNTMRKILALALVLALTAGCVMAAFAETRTTPVVILIQDGDTKEKPWTVDGDVEVVDQTGASIRGKNSGEGEVDINGSITTEGEDVDGLVVYVYQSADVDVIVDGEVTTVYTGEDDTVYNTGVEVTAAGSAVTTVETGDVTVDGGSGCAVLVRTNEDGEAEVQTGNIDSSGEGLRIEANGGPVDAETGDIAAEGIGVDVLTFNADSEVGVTVGDVDAESTGVFVLTQGGTVDVTTGNIEADNTGVNVTFDADWQQTDLTKEEFEALNLDFDTYNVDETSWTDTDTGTEHRVRNWKDDEGTNYNLGYHYEGETLVEDSYWKNAPVYNPGEVTVTVNGDINAASENENADGISLHNAGPGTEFHVNVTGDVKATANAAEMEEDTWAHAGGITVEGAADAHYDVQVGGDVILSAEGEQAYTMGMNLRAEDSSEIAVTVGGDVNSNISMYVPESGSIKVDVGGDIDSAGRAGTMTGNGKAELNVTGDVIADGSQAFEVMDGMDAAITVGGNLVNQGNAEARALELYNTDDFTMDVGGNVIAKGDGGRVTALDLGVFSDNETGKNPKLDIAIGGDLTAETSGAAPVGAVSLSASQADAVITVDGGVTVTQKAGELADDKFYMSDSAYGISAGSYNSDVSVVVGKGVAVTSELEDKKTSTLGISARTSGDDSALTINVQNNGVTVEGENAVAVLASNNGGTMNLNITGDVESTGAGMQLVDSLPEDSESSSETTAVVVGDVTAGTDALMLDLRNDKSSMDVLIDGTVSGESSSVVLKDETLADNITLTVWEIKPNEDGNVAERESRTEDEETGEVTITRTADEAFEKQIQYIIRVEQPEVGSVATEGTSKDGDYDVAHEGDTVTLKVTVPEGYQLADAFNGTDTKVQLLKDANGDFYLVVPRGGAVLLSVSIEKIQEEEKKEESAEGQESEQQQEQKEEPQEQKEPAIVVEPVTDEAVISTLEEVEVLTTPVVNDTPEKLDDAQITAAVEEVLTKNGVLENSVVEVETDDSGAKTVVISPETTEAGEDSTVLQLTVPAEMLTQLADSDVQKLTMVSQSGGATVSMDIAAVLATAAEKQGAKLVMNIEENSESVRSALQAVPAGFTGRAGAVTVTARIEDAEGNVIVLGSSANITLTLNVEFEEGMKILFVDADGNVSETEAVWVEAADGVPGHWEVPFLGEGTYLPVVGNK